MNAFHKRMIVILLQDWGIAYRLENATNTGIKPTFLAKARTKAGVLNIDDVEPMLRVMIDYKARHRKAYMIARDFYAGEQGIRETDVAKSHKCTVSNVSQHLSNCCKFVFTNYYKDYVDAQNIENELMRLLAR